jgi:protein arginine kinase
MISSDQLYRVPAWFSGIGPESDVVISTRIRLARNLADHQFPLHASLADRQAVFAAAVEALKKVPACKGFTVANFAQLKKVNQQFLVEERVASPDLLVMDGDRGVASDADHRVNIMINEEDHLRLQSLDSGYCTLALWEGLDALDSALGQKLALAYDRKYGFLTCCPTNAGTGLRISFLMHLPGLTLTKTIDQVLNAASQMGIATRGFFGEHSEIVGNLFQMSNQTTMGSSEMEFIDAVQAAVMQIVSAERQARQKILTEAKIELTDKIYRAYGILRYSRTLSTNEFLNLTSALRIGIESKLFDGLSVADLNRLTLVILPAHIQTLYDRTMNDDELAIMRSDIVRDFIKQKIDEV